MALSFRPRAAIVPVILLALIGSGTGAGVGCASGGDDDNKDLEAFDRMSLVWVSPLLTTPLEVTNVVQLAVATHNPDARSVHFELDGTEIGVCDPMVPDTIECRRDNVWRWSIVLTRTGRHALRAWFIDSTGKRIETRRDIFVEPDSGAIPIEPGGPEGEPDPIPEEEIVDEGEGGVGGPDVTWEMEQDTGTPLMDAAMDIVMHDAFVDMGTPVMDSGVRDTGIFDSGVRDTGVRDSGIVDSGVRDTGVRDTGIRDTGIRDTGTVTPIRRGYLDPNRGWHNIFGGIQWSVQSQRVLLRVGSLDGSVTAVASCMARYGTSIRRYADQYNISRASVVATALTESNCTNPRGSSDGLSSGPMQVTGTTCAGVTGLSSSVCKTRMHTSPDFSFQVGIRYMASNYQRRQHLNDPPKISAAYNAGSLRATSANRWRMVTTGNHIDRFVAHYNAYRTWERRNGVPLTSGPADRLWEGEHVRTVSELPATAADGQVYFVGEFQTRQGDFYTFHDGHWSRAL